MSLLYPKALRVVSSRTSFGRESVESKIDHVALNGAHGSVHFVVAGHCGEGVSRMLMVLQCLLDILSYS